MIQVTPVVIRLEFLFQRTRIFLVSFHLLMQQRRIQDTTFHFMMRKIKGGFSHLFITTISFSEEQEMNIGSPV